MQMSRGTLARSASTTAAWSSAAAVPLVVTITAGCPLARPIPRAVKAADRSSSRTWVSIPGWRTSATAKGVERDPGQMTACEIPHRVHSSTRVAANSIWMSALPGAGTGIGTLMAEDRTCDAA